MRLSRLLAGAAVLALAPAAVARAQGTVGAQGLGYPPGQLSTISEGAAGALADFDGSSAVNPAAIVNVPTVSLFVHVAPERRRTTVGAASDESRVVRFPVIGAVIPLGSHGAIGLGSSTLLDRTWSTLRDVDGTPDGEGVLEGFEVRGAINDVRLAGAWAFSPRFAAGLGAHLLTGVNQLTVSRVDQAEGGDAGFTSTAEIGFDGTAASAGVQWLVARHLAVAAAGQVGGVVRANRGDSLLAKGRAPARADLDLRYDGITGATLGLRASWRGWSSLDDLGSDVLEANDALEVGFGGDIAGPRVFGSRVAMRLGARWRDLPFGVAGEQPSEIAATGGLGFVLGGGRVLLDLSAERARRTAGDAKETAWVFGAGLTLRP
ncbi:MAG TPA: hypothetical protein VFS08_21160 [Gemmatimonadaceae bacterium]|nr:hypothetical protein [Gemmatimonadaceae bacterium]